MFIIESLVELLIFSWVICLIVVGYLGSAFGLPAFGQPTDDLSKNKPQPEWFKLMGIYVLVGFAIFLLFLGYFFLKSLAVYQCSPKRSHNPGNISSK